MELLVEAEEDDGPLVAIDTDGESDLVVSTAPVNVILEEEEEEPTLSDELKAKVEAESFKATRAKDEAEE